MSTVGDILKGRNTYSATAAWTVRHVMEYLCEKKVGAVPVVDGVEVVGVFSERDLMHRVVHPGLSLEETLVGDVMTRDVIHVEPDTHFKKAKAMMVNHGVRHLVVQDESGQLKGFVSLRELSEVALQEANTLITKLNDSYYQAPSRP